MATTPPASLLATCRTRMLDGTYDLSRLEALPATVLAQLLQACVVDKLAAQAQHAACTMKLADLTKDRYLVQASRSQDRSAVPQTHDRVAAVVAKWEPQPGHWDGLQSHSGWRQHCKELVYCKSKRRFELLPCERWQSWRVFGDGDYLDVWCVVSSALLLYRVCCLFAAQVEVAGPDRYKVVWAAQLKHRTTGERVGFSELKGAAGVHVSRYEGPAEFDADMLELLNLLCGEECPHLDYGQVAGLVA